MSITGIKKIGRPGPAKKFNREDFASNNNYHLWHFYYSVSGNEVNSNGIEHRLVSRHVGTNPGFFAVDLEGFPLGDIIIQYNNWRTSNKIRTGDGVAYSQAGENRLEDGNNVIVTNRALMYHNNQTTGNNDCQVASTVTAFGPSDVLKIGNTGSNDMWALWVKNGWDKDVAQGAVCTASATLDLYMYIRHSLWDNFGNINQNAFPQNVSLSKLV